VEVHGCADQSQMRERLREVPQLLARRPDLLRVEPEVVRVGEHLLEGESGLLEPARARERLDVPERADRERALVAPEAVWRRLDVVATDEAGGGGLPGDVGE